MKRSRILLTGLFCLSSLLLPRAHALLATHKYKTAWGSRTLRADRAMHHLSESHYIDTLLKNYPVTPDDLDFLKNVIGDLAKAERSKTNMISAERVELAYGILKKLDKHDKLRTFSLNDALRDQRKFEEIAASIVLR